ncbi:N(4)-(Beta-N-acetylglucosaminyl)-L-asparaginase-like [Trichogramma pretiosum]|uniref:N(4)-(Beta-N-acetylglucosaminyl)-L-asparaginase- like n=1 Tax=Trichogramma pretiosum TaxID=7493 RepID=UPI0006C9C8C3|nr:N(4)-(Beta-N-acetylglucosaminyl)-L-asparaginase-like [Trichogramma pretiosum]
MFLNKLYYLFFIINFVNLLPRTLGVSKFIPVVITTWDYEEATKIAWKTLYQDKCTAVDAIENGCSYCEEAQCRGTVGFGGSPDENGETTLDAMLMDGSTMDVGGVGSLRNIKHAVSVARHVLENTAHSLIVGDLATDFAEKMGFKRESLQTDSSQLMWKQWENNKCQPNFWKNVVPNPTATCGPYHPKPPKSTLSSRNSLSNEDNHDTIGMIAIDSKGHIAAGTSTNGARNKIPGRVGDSPIAGAGAYADDEVGAAAATGDGDVMMRFLPSFLAVELMRQGQSPESATQAAIDRITKHYPNFSGAVIAVNKHGEFAAACHGFDGFPFYVGNLQLGKPTQFTKICKPKP